MLRHHRLGFDLRTFLTLTLVGLVLSGCDYPLNEKILDSTQLQKEVFVSDAVPTLSVSVVLEKLNRPWDMVMLDDQSFVFTERDNAIKYYRDGEVSALNAPADTNVRGEGGMLGLALDPDFEENQYLYICFNSSLGNLPDVRVARFEFDPSTLELSNRQDIVTGIPANSSGRHSGCQVEFGPDGYLWIGTGDAADENTPQNPQSLGGKILRVDREGNGAPGNLRGVFDARIYSYGHRNVQGLGFYRASDSTDRIGISIEHGSERDDEINALVPGNFGWAPLPSYGEGVPMTDLDKFPEAIPAIWSSGYPTLATSGGTVIQGPQWGAWDKAVAVAAQKSSRIVIFEIDTAAQVTRETALFEVDYGRIRTVVQGTDGNLYFLTDNGSNKDRIVKVEPVRTN